MEIVDVLIEYVEDIENFLTNENYGCLEIVNIKKKSTYAQHAGINCPTTKLILVLK